MRILALDLATNLGWAVGDSADGPTFGTHKLPKVGRSIGRLSEAYVTWLGEMIEEHQPELVIFEMPPARRPKKSTFITRYKLLGFCWDTERVCHLHNVSRCQWVNVSKLKNFWTGNGHAKKSEMVNVAEQLGFAVEDDNQADGLACWCYAVHLHARHDYRWDRMMINAGSAA